MSSRSIAGICYLAGAGPGDLGLVTLRVKELAESAEVIVFDYLCNPEILKWAPPGAEIIYVLDGDLVVNLEGEDFTLGQGDSMYFDCAHPHSYRRKGALLCAAIIVVTAESASA